MSQQMYVIGTRVYTGELAEEFIFASALKNSNNEEGFTWYVLSNGKLIFDTCCDHELDVWKFAGFWIAGIFENGNAVEA